MDNMGMKMNGSGGGMMDMPMYFHSGTMVTLFFKDWMTMSQTEYNGACTALFLVAALYEGLKVLRKFINPSLFNGSKSGYKGKSPPPTLKVKVMFHLIQTVLHIVQVFIGYLMMLAFMTYNTLICVSVLLGYGFGYLAFAWLIEFKKNVDDDDADCCNM